MERAYDMGINMKKRNILYTVECKNQMCNQLFWNSSLLAAAIEYDFDICTLTFEYADKFVLNNSFGDEERAKLYLDLSQASKHVRRIRLRNKILKKDFKVFDIGFDESGKKLEEALKAGLFQKRKYVLGWPFYNPDSLEKHRERVVEFFRPKDEFVYNANAFWDKYASPYEYVIAVHVRRKDYKEYLNGKYYYDNEVYVNAMNHMCELLPDKKLLFIIFSDEISEIEQFKSEKYDIVISKNNAVVDLTIMSKCNYIIAPPSSFSGWASFSGNVPIFRIAERKEPKFSLDDFGVCWISDQYKENLRKRLMMKDNE